jgi:hypothetical protein
MTKLTRRQVLLDKIETVVGAAEIVDPAVNAVLSLNGNEINPDGEKVADDRLSDTLSKQPHAYGKIVSGMTRQHELRGGGITGSAVAEPDYSALLQSAAMLRSDIVFLECGSVSGSFERGETVDGGTSTASGSFIAMVKGGMLLEDASGTFESGETLTGGTSAATASSTAGPITGHQYTPLSDPDTTKSTTTVYYKAGHKFTLYGSRADFSLSLPVGQPGKFSFTQQGRHGDPVEEANPTPTLNLQKPPLVVGLDLKIGDYAPAGVTEVTLAMGNTLSKDEDVSAEDGLNTFVITNRTPTGSIDPKAESLEDFNPWDEWKNGTLAALSFVVGSEAGNRIFIEAPNIQYGTPSHGDREGFLTHSLPFEPKGLNGDDELRLIYF